MTFFPNDYTDEKNELDNGFYKLKAGDNKFRILTDPVNGYEQWMGGKPVRSHTKPDGSSFIFSAFGVWDYEDNRVRVLCIKQKSILRQLESRVKDPDWSDYKTYDITISMWQEGTWKDAEGKDRPSYKYDLRTAIPKQLPKHISDELRSSQLDLDALFANDYPLKRYTPKSLGKKDEMEASVFSSAPIRESSLEELRDRLIEDGIDPEGLNEFLLERVKVAKSPTSLEKVLHGAVQNYGKMKESYLNYMDQQLPF